MPRDISWTTERTQRIDVWPKFYLACCQARRWSICLYITYIIYGPPKTIGIVQYTIIKFLYLKRNYSSISLSLSRAYISIKYVHFKKYRRGKPGNNNSSTTFFELFYGFLSLGELKLFVKKNHETQLTFIKLLYDGLVNQYLYLISCLSKRTPALIRLNSVIV